MDASAGSLTARRPLAGHPIRALFVEVLEGVDRGKTLHEASERLHVGSAESNDLVLTDPSVSRFHVEVVRTGERIALIDHQSTNGTRVGPVWFRDSEVFVAPGTHVVIGDTTLVIAEGPVVFVPLGSPSGFHGVLGRSAPIRKVTAGLGRIAERGTSVLIQGESGTGKELVARAIHDGGPRRAGPFVTFDCGAISPQLLAAELLGHERGAFTGADRARPSVFERAQGGTLLLDEIAELPLEQQSVLLGALERRSVRRLGSATEIPFDVHVVAATHRDLRAAVNAGTFRLDLYFRLAVVTLYVPPLRERVDDIPLLLEHFLVQEGEAGPLERFFPRTVLSALERHDWSGNVRELRNYVQATLALGQPAPLLGASDHGSAARSASEDTSHPTVTSPERYRDAKQRVVTEFERSYLQNLLAHTGGNIREAARRGQLDRSHLIELLDRHKLR